jgi:hypothetical protein
MFVTTGQEVLKRRLFMKTRSEIRLFRTLAVCALCICMVGVSAQAKLYIFGQVTGGDMGLCPDAFKMDVSPNPDNENQALFTFTNDCDSDGVLGRFFFMENDLMVYNMVFAASERYDQYDEIPFSLYEKNAMLPGGHPLGFTPQNSFGVYADPARPKTGLQYEEYVSILFDINVDDGYTFDDIIAEIDGQSLGVGLHAQALPGGVSASFSTIPEPLTLSLLGIAALPNRL